MTDQIGTSFGEADQQRHDSSVRRGLGLLALATVVAGMVFASNEALHVSPVTAEPQIDSTATTAVPSGRAASPPVIVPAADFDPATLRPQQPAVGMPEHG